MYTVIIVLGIIGFIAAIPITGILTHHQRKMAELLNRPGARNSDPDTIARLAHEVSELRQLVAQQAIALDDLSSMHRRLLERSIDDAAVRQRLGN